ncbi:nitroreductase [Chloroflexota bacterium]
MDIIEAIHTRRSIRSFKPAPVPKKVLGELLDVCRWAPSGGNSQPWYFAVLGGKVLDEVKARLEEKVKTSWNGNTFTDMNPDLPRTVPHAEFLTSRRQAWVEYMDSYRYPSGPKSLEEKQHEYRVKLQRFFDAPNAIIIYSDDPSPPNVMGSIGIVSQTICLAALAYGLGTCIMGLPVAWPEIYRELLGIPEGKPIATSIAIGYPDLEAQINTFPRLREPLNSLVEWYGV